MARDLCSHLEQLERRRAQPVHPGAKGCEECLATGDRWVHLRLCLTCGHVGCCDDSPRRHARAHYHATQHPVIKSFEPHEDWAWCFAHEQGVDAIPTFSEESPRRHYDVPYL